MFRACRVVPAQRGEFSMTIRTAITRTLVASGLLVLAGVAGVALMQGHATAAHATYTTTSAPTRPQGMRDPSNLADRLLLDKLIIVVDPRAAPAMPRFVRQGDTMR